MPWTKDDMLTAALAARARYMESNQGLHGSIKSVINAVAPMIIDNAATIVEIHAPDIPELQEKINDMKDDF